MHTILKLFLLTNAYTFYHFEAIFVAKMYKKNGQKETKGEGEARDPLSNVFGRDFRGCKKPMELITWKAANWARDKLMENVGLLERWNAGQPTKKFQLTDRQPHKPMGLSVYESARYDQLYPFYFFWLAGRYWEHGNTNAATNDASVYASAPAPAPIPASIPAPIPASTSSCDSPSNSSWLDVVGGASAGIMSDMAKASFVAESPIDQAEIKKLVKQGIPQAGGGFTCPICNLKIGKALHRTRLRQHIESIHLQLRMFECPDCHRRFYRKDNLHSHMKAGHGAPRFNCSECKSVYRYEHDLKKHYKRKH